MKKNGFTLTELMAVIVILGLLIGVGTFGVVNAIHRSKEKTATKMRNELLDSAVAYGLDQLFLNKCPIGFDPTENLTSSDKSCYQEITARVIIEDEAIYRDDAGHCDREGKIIIYNDNGEYKAYANDNICSN